jgi:hypothetical protein
MAGRIVYVVAMMAMVFCAAVNAYTLQVAYPLWRVVGAGEFGAVHREYLRRLWPVITVPHGLMFLATAGLIWVRPGFVPRGEAVGLFLLAAGVVGISAFVAGPIHGRFERTGVLDAAGYRVLMAVSVARVVMMVAACGVLGVEMVRGW